MGDRTRIEWTRGDDGTPGATWNPVTGCTKLSPASPGCANCYASTLAERFRGTPGHYFENGFDVQLRPDKLDQPLRWTKPRRVFVNSMSDLFHTDIPDDYIARVFAVMALASQHTFQVLTKRHGRMRALLNSEQFRLTVAAIIEHRGYLDEPFGAVAPIVDPLLDHAWPLPNVWLGVSAENQQWADARIPVLMSTRAATRFVSAEPLLGPIDFDRDAYEIGPWLGELDWVIVGGESGGRARPMNPDWARSIRDQCQSAGVAFLFKQWGEWAPVSGHRYSDFEQLGTNPADTVRKVGKKAAGRELDGRTWDEFPCVVPSSRGVAVP